MSNQVNVAIVGAGLTGLSAAHYLLKSSPNLKIKVFEATDAVGGRVKTDKLDGFILDRGFQVFLTAYLDAKALLDYSGLALNSYKAGALVRKSGEFYRVVDPWRDPVGGVQSLFAPVGTVNDKLAVARLKSALMTTSLEDIWQSPDETTMSYLRGFGFSQAMIDDFFTPFFSGVFLEKELATSSRMFKFLFKMFSTGETTIPSLGMQAIPEQIAASLPSDVVQLNQTVVKVASQNLTLSSGESISADVVIVATDGYQASQLLPDFVKPPSFKAATNAYYKTQKAPVSEPILMISTDKHGLINTVSVPSLVSPNYAPSGWHLVNVSCLGEKTADWQEKLEKELTEWFGPEVLNWELLKIDEIKHALPSMHVDHSPQPFQVLKSGLYRCGDDLETASINGAIKSGQCVANAVIKTLVTA